MLAHLILLMAIQRNYNEHKIYFEICDKVEETFCDTSQNR